MKHQFLPLSVLYLSCATPPQPASPAVVEIIGPTPSYSPEQKPEDHLPEKEFSREKMIREALMYLEKVPPDIYVSVRDGGSHFAYSYGASKYCISNPSNVDENMQKYPEMAALTFSRTTINGVVLFDIPPLGSVDKIAQLSFRYRSGVDGVELYVGAEFYHASESAQEFYEAILSSLHQELQQHFREGRHWGSFSAEREIDDPEKKIEKAYEELMADLKLKSPAPEEEVEFLAPCKE